jgi:hypothetical protein
VNRQKKVNDVQKAHVSPNALGVFGHVLLNMEYVAIWKAHIVTDNFDSFLHVVTLAAAEKSRTQSVLSRLGVASCLVQNIGNDGVAVCNIPTPMISRCLKFHCRPTKHVATFSSFF